jgi:hypothetical protein
MKGCAVIVTYGDIFYLLKQVMDACYKESLSKIIVVYNDSIESSKIELKKYENKNKNILKMIYLNESTGFTGGYKRGLEEAYTDEEYDFIWLIDDNNPQQKSLKLLKNFWNNLSNENKNEKFLLLSYRQDRVAYKEAIITNIGIKNSFLGLYIVGLPKKVLKIVKRKLGFKIFVKNQTIKSGKVSVVSYGGPESIIVNENIGILCNIDEVSLSNALQKMIGLERQCDPMFIRQYVLDNFSENIVASKIFETYKNVLIKSRGENL